MNQHSCKFEHNICYIESHCALARVTELAIGGFDDEATPPDTWAGDRPPSVSMAFATWVRGSP